MNPELSGVLIGAGSIVGAAILVALAAAIIRVWRTPKRLDRLERVVPPIARGLWALLGEHVRDHNGDTSPEVAEAYKLLTEVVTESVVSQKGTK